MVFIRYRTGDSQVYAFVYNDMGSLRYLTSVLIKIAPFREITPCRFVNKEQRVGGGVQPSYYE